MSPIEMRILMLTPYLPFPLLTGGQTRSYNLIKRLSKLGHEITLFGLIKDKKEEIYKSELEKYCKEVKVFYRSRVPWTLNNVINTGFSAFPFLVIRNWADGEKEAISKEIANEKFDLIHAETFYVMPHIPQTSIPILLVEQTIEYLVYSHFASQNRYFFLKPLFYIDIAKLKYWEIKYWKKAAKVAAMSLDDKKIMQREVDNLQVDIVPNGVDINYFDQIKAKKSEIPIILYLGNFTWLQNREAVDILYRQVWPKIKHEIKNAKLWVVGKEAKKFFKNIENDDVLVGEVEDVRIPYQKAWVLVAPIYGGGGTRYKNFEAFASGLPVVTTSIGIGGTDAEDGKEIIIRDEPFEIAKASIDLIKDKKRYGYIAQNAKKMVKDKYDWDPIAKKLSDIYEKLAQA